MRNGSPGAAPAVAYAASAAQRRTWLLHEACAGAAVYNVPLAIRPASRLDAGALRRAVRALVAHQPVLRTRYRMHGDALVQLVDAEPLDVFGVRDVAGDLDAAAHGEGRRPFDLAADHPLRVALLRGADADLLVVTLHHVATDAWSTALVLEQLAAFYAAERTGAPRPAALERTYADFAAWEARCASDGSRRASLAYWREALAGAPPLLDLPTDRPRAPGAAPAGAQLALELTPTAGAALGELARTHAVSPFAVVAALFAAVLARRAGCTELVLGTMTAGRDRPELRALAGQCLNTLPLRLRAEPGEPLDALLARTQRTIRDALAHGAVPYDEIVAAAQPARVPGAAPLAQVFVNFVDAVAPALAFDGAPAEVRQLETGWTRFDLGLHVERRPDGFALALEYAQALFDRATAEEIGAQLLAALEAAAAPRRARAAEVPRALPSAGAPPSLVALIAAQAARTPDAAAFEHGGEPCSYAELERRANALARRLRALGVGRDALVGVCAGRCAALLPALLAIWKAGGAYVPLDPGDPDARLARTLAAARPAAVVADRRNAGRFAAGPQLLLLDEPVSDDAPPDAPSDVHPDQLAYVLYTSGSRGVPKGVAFPHRALGGFFLGVEALRLHAGDRVLQHSSLAWDVFVIETWMALAQGACCVLAPDEPASPETLPAWIEDARITFAWLTSSLFGAIAPADLPRLASLRAVVAGGDALRHEPLERARAVLPRTTFANGYGPTETHLATIGVFPPGARVPAPPPIGVAIGDRLVYVLDERLDPVPAGVLGELHVGGDAVMRGYLRDPARTAERCVPDPFAVRPGARMYATGDLVRRRPDGRLVFAGRRDDQRKVRGYRLELGEIEAALRAADGVRDAAVAVREVGGADSLVAYVVPQPGFDRERALDALARALPPYAVPSALVTLGAIPLNANGKADPARLPAPGERELRDAFVAPRGETERIVAACFAEVLDVARVGAHDDFFALGGNSLLVPRVAGRLRDALAKSVHARDVLAAPRVAQLAARLDGMPDAPAPAPAATQDETAPLTPGQQRLWFLHRLDPASTRYHFPLAWRIDGELDRTALGAAVDALAERHAILRTRYEDDAEGEPHAHVDPPRAGLLRERAAASYAQARALVEEEIARPFDLARGAPLRALLVTVSPELHALALTVHHVAFDGGSLDVVARDLSELYAAARGAAAARAAPALQHADFARWAAGEQARARAAADLRWWTEVLRDPPPAAAPPFDRAAVPGSRGRERSVVRALAPELRAAVRALAMERAVTPFAVLLAAFASALREHAPGGDLLIGTVASLRSRPELDGVVGFLVNTLPLRLRLAGADSPDRVLAVAHDALRGALAHADAPFDEIVAAVAPGRTAAAQPLIRTLFTLEPACAAPLDLAPARAFALDLHLAEPKFELAVAVARREEHDEIVVRYDAERYDGATARALAKRFDAELAALAACAGDVRRA